MGREPAIGFLGLEVRAPRATAALARAPGLIAAVADENSDPAITGRLTSQGENNSDGVLVLFNEDAFAFAYRGHQYIASFRLNVGVGSQVQSDVQSGVKT